MTPISDERLAEMLAEVEIEFDNALSDAEADQNPQLAVDPVGEFDLIELRSILSELQSVRARAEAAERERDEAYNKGYSARDEVVSACRSRAEAAEARLKELEEALEPFASEVTAKWADENGWTVSACQNDRICDWFWPSDFFAVRTALKGGSNG